MKDCYAWFRDMVRDRRKMDGAVLDTVSDGRVFTGRQALAAEAWSIEIGNEKTAIAWLATEKGMKARHAGARLAAEAALQRSAACCTSPPSWRSMRWACARSRSASKAWAPSRRSKDSILTVS